jgi:hypothetical protein
MADPLHPTWIGAGFDPKLVLPSEGAAFREAASSIIHDMDQYCERFFAVCGGALHFPSRRPV